MHALLEETGFHRILKAGKTLREYLHSYYEECPED